MSSMSNKTKEVIKILGYILIPIFVVIAVFSALSLYYRSENQQVQEMDSFRFYNRKFRCIEIGDE